MCSRHGAPSVWVTNEMVDKSEAPGSEYELLTERLMAALGAQSSVETVELTRLKRLKGVQTGTQLTIDIWWRFKINGHLHALAFQCKDWSSRIKQEHVYAFRGVLDDLPESPRGIMVTKTGYQRGAKLVAEAHGITILELREPSDSDWKGKVRDIHITFVAVHPQWRNFSLILPEGHPETPETLPPGFGGFMEKMFLVDSEGERVASFREIADRYLPEGFEVADWTKIDHRFEEILFLTPPTTNEESSLRLPVIGVSFEVARQGAKTRLHSWGTNSCDTSSAMLSRMKPSASTRMRTLARQLRLRPGSVPPRAGAAMVSRPRPRPSGNSPSRREKRRSVAAAETLSSSPTP